jgi:hypothetical protein
MVRAEGQNEGQNEGQDRTHVATSKQSWVGIPPNNEKKNKV